MSKIEGLENFFNDFSSTITQLTTKFVDIGIGNLHPTASLAPVLKVGVDFAFESLKIYATNTFMLNKIQEAVNKEQTNETKTPEQTVNKEQTNDKGKGVDDYSPSM